MRGAAKDVFYYGFKLGLRTTQYGLIAHHALLEANTCDCRHLPALVEGHQGVVPVDKGFFDPIGGCLVAKEGVPRVRTRPPKGGQAPARGTASSPLAGEVLRTSAKEGGNGRLLALLTL